jgi:hypothetical protein
VLLSSFRYRWAWFVSSMRWTTRIFHWRSINSF